jgi:hypothetical protein
MWYKTWCDISFMFSRCDFAGKNFFRKHSLRERKKREAGASTNKGSSDDPSSLFLYLIFCAAAGREARKHKEFSASRIRVSVSREGFPQAAKGFRKSRRVSARRERFPQAAKGSTNREGFPHAAKVFRMPRRVSASCWRVSTSRVPKWLQMQASLFGR